MSTSFFGSSRTESPILARNVRKRLIKPMAGISEEHCPVSTGTDASMISVAWLHRFHPVRPMLAARHSASRFAVTRAPFFRG
jgi:hypothetical protein